MKQNTKAVGDVNVLYDKSNISMIIRSTAPSRPNNIRGGNVHPSVHPSTKSFSDFSEIGM